MSSNIRIEKNCDFCNCKFTTKTTKQDSVQIDVAAVVGSIQHGKKN